MPRKSFPCPDCGTPIRSPAARCFPCTWAAKRTPIEERFIAKVHKTDGCWLWTGATTSTGYGHLTTGGNRGLPVKAHRLAFELAKGPVPVGFEVCHHCDNPLCVRPDHLFLGSRRDNVDDALAKGRYASGAGNGIHTHPPRRDGLGRFAGRAR